MDRNYLIDISIIKNLLKTNNDFNECLAKVKISDINDAFNNKLGYKAFDIDKYNNGHCFFKVVRNDMSGVDIPVKISNERKAIGTKIMFVGESVLRKIKDFKNFANCGLLIGTPFAIVGKYDQPSSCNVYKLIFREWLEYGYEIYVTDYIKMWSNDKNYLKDNCICKLSQELLGKEIEAFQPNFIVPFGKKAKEAINRITTESNTIKKEQVIDVTHPSNNAKVHWKIEMYEELLDAILKPENCKCIRELTEMEGYKVFKFNENRVVKNENVANYANQIIQIKINPNQN